MKFLSKKKIKGIPENLVEIKIINLDTGVKETLHTKEDNNRCHFTDIHKFPINSTSYFIQLRLDWFDIKNGEPMLDVDIWTETDIWNLVYLIISFRSEAKPGGTFMYLIR